MVGRRRCERGAWCRRRTFRHLYWHRAPWPNLRSAFNRRVAARDIGASWDVKSLVAPHATYHAGSYLSAMLFLLYVFLVTSWVPLIIVARSALYQRDHTLHAYAGYIASGVGVFVLVCLVNVWFIERRRVILESELLSIHSSAIMWEVVVVAHKRALAEVSAHHFNGYSRALALQTKKLLEQVGDIHAWLVPLSGQNPPPRIDVRAV